MKVRRGTFRSMDQALLFFFLATLRFGVASMNVDITRQEEEEEVTYPKSWIVVQFVTASLISLVCLMAIVCIGAVARYKPSSFNMYLIFILLPDALLNGMWAISLFWEATHEGVYDATLCIVRNWVSYFYYFGNLYLNAVVAREIYILVLNSYQRQRTPPPSRRKVALQVGGTYLFVCLPSTWIVVDTRWSPFTIVDLESCITVSGSTGDDPVFNAWTSNLAAMVMVGGPFLYVFYVGYRIGKQRLLPIKGRTRAVALYFFRIVFIFVLFYIPNILLAVVLANIPPEDYSVSARFWGVWVYTIMIPGQTLATLRLAIMKEDVADAVRTMSRRGTTVLLRPLKSSTFFLASSSTMDSDRLSSGLFRRSKTKSSEGDESNPFGDSKSGVGNNNIEAENGISMGNGITSEWEEEDVYEGDETTMDKKDIGDEDDDHVLPRDVDSCLAG